MTSDENNETYIEGPIIWKILKTDKFIFLKFHPYLKRISGYRD